ncbi:MAG: hypothetical protein JO257_21350 [Deltaproteobacteria bacterium]|nr:hypothetical protein [Deltaproteobacteria bacterium]
MKWLSAGIGGLLFFGASLYLGEVLAVGGGLTFHGALPGPASSNTPWSTIMVDGIVLLVGIVIGNLYGRLKILRTKGVVDVNIGGELGGMVKSIDFWLGLCAAPVVFGVVINLAHGTTLVASSVLAFQNGFFWQTVMPTKPATA